MFSNLGRSLKESKRLCCFVINFFLILSLIFQNLFFLRTPAYAVTNTWDFTTSSNYTYDNTKIEFSSGRAQLKPTSNWYNTGWSYRKKITIDHLKVQADLTNFPVLVNLSSDSDLASRVQSDGDDILFTSSNGTTKLSHEIEKYTSATGELVSWVKIPSLSSTTDTDIYLYYGNASASNSQDATNVWDANYVDVWHKDDGVPATIEVKTELASVTMSSVRGGVGMAAIGDKVYIAGGTISGGAFLKNMEVYDATAQTITPKADMPDIRGKPFSGAVGGKVYIIGGASESSHVGKNQVWEYDPSLDSWATKASTLPIKAGFGASVVYNNKIYCISGGDTGYHPIGKLQIYDPSTDTWSYGADLPAGYANDDGMAGVLTVGGKDYIYHLLGISSTAPPPVADRRLIRYDIAADNWETGFAQYPETFGAGSPVVLNNKLTILGGWNWTTNRTTNRIYTYDPNADSWSYQGTTVGNDVESVLMSAKVSDNLVIVVNGYENEYGTGSFLNKITRVSISTPSILVPIDNTIHSNPGIKKATNEPAEATGKIGKAQSYDGNDYVSTIITQPNIYSLSAWVKPNSLPAVTGFVTSLNNYAMDMQYLSDGKVAFQVSSGNSVTSVNTLNVGSWGYIVVIYDGTNAKIYLNGNLEASLAKTLSTGNSHLFLGKRSDGYFFNGLVDEIQISNTARSADWIKTSYNNQNSPSSFYSLGSPGSFYQSDNPSINPTSLNAQTFTSYSGFSETATKNGGEIKYQISNNAGSTWYWWNGSSWVATTAGYTEANLASDINTNISSFPTGNGQFLFKAYLHSDGSQLVQLTSVAATYWPTTLSFSSPTGYTNNTKPTLVFNKATNASSYSVSLDSGKNRSFSTSGIPSAGNGSANYVWKNDSSVKVEFLNENDSDSSNDEIRVYFKDLDKQDLTEGKHTWTVTTYDNASNSTSKSVDFYLDKTNPSVSDLAIANLSTIAQGQVYQLDVSNRMPSFSGKATDTYQGSTKTNDNGTKDTFDKVSSGPDSITLTLKRLKGDENPDSVNPVYLDHLTKEYSLTDIKDEVNSEKYSRFYITTPYPLVNGYYQVNLSLKDKAGNTYSHPAFYLSLNYNQPSSPLEVKIIEEEKIPAVTEEEKEQVKKEGYTVKIKVTDKDKNPVEGAKVTIHSEAQEAITNKEGIAEFKGVEPGEHKVIIAYSGYEGEQKINLTGEVKEFDLNVQIKPQNLWTFPPMVAISGASLLIIIILLFLLAKAKKKNTTQSFN